MKSASGTTKTFSINEAVRREAIDLFRGFAILLMVLANFLTGVENLPAWMKHAPGVGLTIVDLIAPFFIFAIALTYRTSWQRRCQRDGAKGSAEHFFERYVAIAGIGFFLTILDVYIEGAVWREPWGVLQAIGAAGLLTLPVIALSWPLRLIAGLGVLGVYQFLLQSRWLEEVRNASHGGLRGSLGWGAMLILGTALADFYNDGDRSRRRFPLAACAFLGSGAILTVSIPMGKVWVSASYVLVSVGASGLAFQLFEYVSENLRFRPAVLSAWGRNPLVLYLLHIVLLGGFVLPAAPGWYARAPAWLTALEALALLGVLSILGFIFQRKGWYCSL